MGVYLIYLASVRYGYSVVDHLGQCGFGCMLIFELHEKNAFMRVELMA